MKKSQPWHHTRAGTVILWLGSIELAVPVLIFTAAALAWGTWLESTQNARVSRAAVYGSWWFVGLMGLVCLSLVFAVVTRYPWKRKHLGFITVHASLIALIAGGFWSLFGRVEGRLGLEEGRASDMIETHDEIVELVEHRGGQFVTLASAPAPDGPGALVLGALRVQALERWENSREEQSVADDGPEAFRALRMSVHPGPHDIWVGQEDKAGGPSVLGGLRVRVLADGATWEPTAASSAAPDSFVFVLGEQRTSLGRPGEEAFPGWTITEVKEYERAMVSAGGMSESPSGPPNAAVEVTIADGKGTSERHTAFVNFPEMVMSKVLQGGAPSGAKLLPMSGAAGGDTLVVYGPLSAPGFAWVTAGGETRPLPDQTGWPRTHELGTRRVTISEQFARARGVSRTAKAPTATDNRPALVMRLGDATDLTICAWKGMAPASGGGLMLRYGPRLVQLPFTVRLNEFRKTDYPGTETAMAYESDVSVTAPGDAAPTPFRIFMNNPYTRGPWRVYQSGFVGGTVSIFSVMRDPGLPLTYAASTLLCVGIALTFFSRSLSWGHPGIPIAPSDKDTSHAPLSALPDPVAPDHGAVRDPVGAGV